MHKKISEKLFLNPLRSSVIILILLVSIFSGIWHFTSAESALFSCSGSRSDGSDLTADRIIADPELLHKLIKEKNPSYQGKALFVKDPELGLAADFSGDVITDLSPLNGIPFEALDLKGQPVSDLEPLRGMPLKILGIEDTPVADLSPLKGMQLKKLYLNNTAVSDISPLAGMPLSELMLVGTKIKNISPIKGAPLNMLWLNSTAVDDISPLADAPLISLTLENTEVSDIKPVSRITSLKRLHIGGTKIRDLSPLENLALERLIFTPGNINSGIRIVRNMKSIMEIGPSLEVVMPPDEFWRRYDLGKWK